MFQLILGISLGVILLFVILLLITEVAATYPVWKQIDSSFSRQTPTQPQQNKRGRNALKLLILVLTAVGILCVLGYLINNKTEPQQTAPGINAENATATVYTKLLSANSADYLLSFRLQTKWQDGKLYGNNSITFNTDSVWRPTDCRYYLLDREGFLIKEIVFSPDDFVFETNPSGRTRGLVNKFNTQLSLQEYRKIEKLQVVLDEKLSPLSP